MRNLRWPFVSLLLMSCSDGEPGSPPSFDAPLDERALFEALDLERGDLAAVRAAWEAGDVPAARGALAAHLRTRSSPWELDAIDHPDDDEEGEGDEEGVAAPEDVVAEAERLVRAEVTIVGVPHAFPGGDIDWAFNATRARDDLPFNRQWGNHLNRTRFWRPLAEAYLATGDERYAVAWVTQLRDFIADNPFDRDADPSIRPAWKTLIAASRMKNTWPDLLTVFRGSPSVTDDDLVLLLRSCLEHGRHLRAHHDHGLDNHLAVEMRGLLTVGCLFPEFREARDWRRHALSTAAEAVGGMFYPDGVSMELSPGYHKLSLDEFWRMRTLATACGFGDEVPAGFVAALAPAVRAAVLLSTPERTLPSLNDSGTPDVPELLADKVGLFPDDDAVRWLVTDGAEGAPPAERSHFFPWAGLAVMRSGWERDATYGLFDVGPLGTDHVHQDKLNLVVWARGRELLYDNGGGSYEESEWREFGADTHAHNCVTIDGLGQRRARGRKADRVSDGPIDAGWQSEIRIGQETVQVRGSYDGGWGDAPRDEKKPIGRSLARHTRRVFFDGQWGRFVVVDDLEPVDDEEHAYAARWHLRSTSTKLAPESGICVTVDEGLPNLAVVPLGASLPAVRIVTGEREPELLGWDLGKRGAPPVPTDTVVHERRGRGAQRFVTLLVPIGSKGRAPEFRVSRVDGADVVEFTDGRNIAIEVPADVTAPLVVDRWIY